MYLLALKSLQNNDSLEAMSTLSTWVSLCCILLKGTRDPWRNAWFQVGSQENTKKAWRVTAGEKVLRTKGKSRSHEARLEVLWLAKFGMWESLSNNNSNCKYNTSNFKNTSNLKKVDSGKVVRIKMELLCQTLTRKGGRCWQCGAVG